MTATIDETEAAQAADEAPVTEDPRLSPADLAAIDGWYPPTLRHALALFQADLPHISKKGEADAGTYKYSYAELSDVAREVLTRLGRLGCSYSAITDYVDSKFMLVYTLEHVSGDKKVGYWPLPSGNPQQVGSAMTYARRYGLLILSGVAPAGEDDDGAAAKDKPLVPEQVPDDGNWWEWRDRIAALATLQDCAKADTEVRKQYSDGGRFQGQFAKADAIRNAIRARGQDIKKAAAEAAKQEAGQDSTPQAEQPQGEPGNTAEDAQIAADTASGQAMDDAEALAEQNAGDAPLHEDPVVADLIARARAAKTVDELGEVREAAKKASKLGVKIDIPGKGKGNFALYIGTLRADLTNAEEAGLFPAPDES